MSIHQIKPHLLVVGGTGFIGYHLALSAKKKGWKVTSVSIKKPKKHRHINGVKYLRVDINNFQKLKKKLTDSFDYVVNLGGYVNHTSFENGGEKLTRSHFVGVVNLVKIISKKRISKFVQVGSCAEYGETRAPQKESYEGLPISPYAMAKLASTQFLIMLFNTSRFPACVIRFFQVYGPAQDQNRILPKIIRGCLKNKKVPVSKGDQIRDFCYIDDAISAIFLALKSNKSSGEIFNIGLGVPIKIKSAVKTIYKIINKGHIQFGKIKYREDENMSVYPDINKARIKLNWIPKFSFNRGIKIVINSFE